LHFVGDQLQNAINEAGTPRESIIVHACGGAPAQRQPLKPIFPTPSIDTKWVQIEEFTGGTLTILVDPRTAKRGAGEFKNQVTMWTLKNYPNTKAEHCSWCKVGHSTLLQYTYECSEPKLQVLNAMIYFDSPMGRGDIVNQHIPQFGNSKPANEAAWKIACDIPK
jgi:hypothetical protein